MIINEIVGLFVQEFGRELTINQISKGLTKSYGSVNQHVNSMIKRGLLNKKVIGSAILCSLNYDNPELIPILVYLSMVKSTTIKKPENNELCFLVGKKHYTLGKGGPKGFLVINKEKLVDFVKKRLGDIIVLRGHEQFWEIVSKIH